MKPWIVEALVRRQAGRPRWLASDPMTWTRARRDARAEGCTGRDPEPADEGGTVYAWQGRSSAPCPRAHFAALWDHLNGKRAPWSSNPWVWVVEFRRLEVRGG